MTSTIDLVGYMKHFSRSTHAVLEIHKELADNGEELQSLLRHTTPTPRPRDCIPLRRFEEHVSQIDTELAKLKAAITLITQYVEAGRSLLSPIRKLPAEILQRIFQICCEDGIVIDVMEGQHAMPMPVVLSRVCTLWRGLTVSLPTLWSTLKYEIHTKSVEKAGRCLRITELFLQRAQHAPLTLSFDVSPTMDNMAHMDSSLNALCRRAKQWTSVSFEIPSIFLQHSAFYALKGKLQNLHAIQFIELQHGDSAEYLSVLDFLGNCPALRVADFDLFTFRPVDRLPEIPWSQLTSLLLKSAPRTPPPSCIISLCHSLMSLEVMVLGAWTSGPGQDIHTMPKLRSLRVDRVGGRTAVYQQFFQRFTFPNLKFLDLRSSRWGVLHNEEMDSVYEFLRRSSCPIESLSLVGWPFNEKQLSNILQQCLPDISTLILHEKRLDIVRDWPSRTSGLLEHLLVQPGHDPSSHARPLLPHLIKLKLTVSSDTLPSLDKLLKTVESRCGPGPEIVVYRLRAVEVVFLDDNEGEKMPSLSMQEALKQLESLREGGLKVTITGIPGA